MSFFEIGGRQIAAGTNQTIELEVSVLANSTRMNLPVHVVHGDRPGPVMFISGVVHGDEIQGVEIVRRILAAAGADWVMRRSTAKRAVAKRPAALIRGARE